MSSSTTTIGATTSSFVVTLVIDLVVGGLLFIMFCYFRRMRTFRWIYQPRLDASRRKSAAVPAPPPVPNSLFGWIPHTYRVDSEVLLRTSGMDNTMYTMWFGSMFKLMCWLFIPALAILLPINITGENNLQSFDRLSMSNIGQNSVRLWAHLCVFYYAMIVTMYWLYRGYRLWLNLRIDYLKQAMFKGGAMSIAFTDLPPAYRSDEAFYHFAYDIFGDHLHSTYLPRDLNKLHAAIMKRANVINQLEQLITKQRHRHAQHVKKQPVNSHEHIKTTEASPSPVSSINDRDMENQLQRRRLSHPPQLLTDDPQKPNANDVQMEPWMQYKWHGFKQGWKKIDIIAYYTAKLSQYNEIITHEQRDAPMKPPQAVGIVTLRSALMTAMASRTPGSVDPFSLHVRPCPEPEDIDWNNIRIDDEYKTLRTYMITLAVLAGVVFYCVPVTFFTGLTSIEGLQKILPNVAAAAQQNVIVNGLVTGFLPALGYIIFMALLPLVLKLASIAEGRPSRSSIQMGIFEKYFLYQFVNFFIFTIFSGAVLTTFTDLVNNPGDAASLFGQSVPTVATQFINYIVTRNFLMQPLKLLAYDDLLLNSIGAAFAATKREKQRALNNLTNPAFGSDFPINICVWIIAITYCTISPILVPFAAVFFGVGYIIAKYQALYMNIAKYETGGMFWPKCFNRMCVGMILAELAMIGIFGVKAAAVQSVLVVPLLVGTCIYAYTVNKTFSQWQGLLPIEAAVQIDRARIENKQMLIDSDDVRDYTSTKGVSPYRQPELIAPRDLQPFYTDPLTVLQASISEGAQNDLGESTRADVPSRLELIHENYIEQMHDDDGLKPYAVSINGTPTNAGRKRQSLIHTDHYDDSHTPSSKTQTQNNTDGNTVVDLKSSKHKHTLPSTNPWQFNGQSNSSVFNDTRTRNEDHVNVPVSSQRIIDMHGEGRDNGENTSNATDIAALIDVQKSVPDKDKYTNTRLTSPDDINGNDVATTDEDRSNISKALDAI